MSKIFPIYLVSLEKDVKRREELKIRFPKYYESFIYIPAIDGRELSAKTYYNKIISYFILNNKVLSPGELGASLSHINALENFMLSTANYALILEDDIIGNDSDIDTAMESISTLQQSDFLLLGGQQGLNKRFQLGKENVKGNLSKVSSFSRKFVTRACCYVVSRETAKCILNHQAKHIELADKWDAFFKGTNTEIYFKDIFKHPVDLSGSHIESERRYQDKKFIKKLFSIEGPKKIYNKIYNNCMVFILKAIGFKKL